MRPALEHIMTFRVDVGTPIAIGGSPGNGRRYVPILGGEVSGRYKGRILPGGDWQIVMPDGRLEIAARYIIEIDGALVEVQSDGLRHGSPEALARLARGEDVDPKEYYFRTCIRLRTGAPALARLNTRLFIAYGARQASVVELEIHEVL